jgi:hypothetical protein
MCVLILNTKIKKCAQKLLRGSYSGAFFIPDFIYQPGRGNISKVGEHPVY